MTARQAPQEKAARRLVVLLVFFILAQTLGWMHRSLHGAPAPAAATRLEALSSAVAPAHGHHREGGLHGLVPAHQDASDCQLFDAVTQADGLPAPLAVAGLPPATAVPEAAPAAVVARRAALFDARGPPVFRS